MLKELFRSKSCQCKNGRVDVGFCCYPHRRIKVACASTGRFLLHGSTISYLLFIYDGHLVVYGERWQDNVSIRMDLAEVDIKIAATICSYLFVLFDFFLCVSSPLLL
ncbi:hypothetical protein OUZ56_016677 [Daphnia magna]|uniref:Uncharacterized protein n=1 Tax=Daphnia magna TaxID=35525 RepID=A0ABR0AR77_9CRUS|nr:hypothetical protein OUZ56_016677 [Daphnia magna]